MIDIERLQRSRTARRSARSSSTTPSTSTPATRGYASLFAERRRARRPARRGGRAGGDRGRSSTRHLGPYVRGDLPPSIHVMNNHRIDVDGDTAKTEWSGSTSPSIPTPCRRSSSPAATTTTSCVRTGGGRSPATTSPGSIGRSPMMPAPDTRLDAARRAGCRCSRTRTRSGGLFMSTSGTSTPRLQGLRVAVHRRRGVDRQPRQGDRSGRDRGRCWCRRSRCSPATANARTTSCSTR